jgi:cell division protease FtsH
MPVPHKFDDTILYKIVIHEMGHVICGLLSKEHSKIIKVVVNLNSPNMPAYTLFESADDVSGHIYTRISLKEHLIILLAGRIAEEEIFGVSVTTGAINDFEEALKIAQKMVINYGMGTNIIYPYNSDYYKKKIDDEIFILIEDAYSTAKNIVSKYRMFILKGADILLQNKVIYYNELHNLLNQHIINYNRIIY